MSSGRSRIPKEKTVLVLHSSTGASWQGVASGFLGKARKYGWRVHTVEYMPDAKAIAELLAFWRPSGIMAECGTDEEGVFSPAAFGQVPVVYSKIREFLMQRGMYIPLKKCYLNLSAGRCYKIYNLLWNDGKERMWNMLHSKYAEEMDWLGHEKESFESLEVYEFVANVVLYTYAEHLQREEQGKIINVEKLDKDNLNKKVTEQQKISRRRALWNKITSIIKK